MYDFYDCLRYEGDRRDFEDDDDHALGLHLFFQHRIRDTEGFNPILHRGGVKLTPPNGYYFLNHQNFI